MRRSEKGFTLIEMMIVVAIIGILAAIAIPGWSMVVAKSRQVEAKEGLSAIHALEVVYRAEKHTYGNLATLGYVSEGAGRYTFCVGDPSVAGSCESNGSGVSGVGAGGGAMSNLGNGGGDGCGGGGTGGGNGGGDGALASGGGNGGFTGNGGGGCSSGTGGGIGNLGPPVSDTGTDTGAGAVAGGSTPGPAQNSHFSATDFEGDAFGQISAKADLDVWSIDQKLRLANVVPGY